MLSLLAVSRSIVAVLPVWYYSTRSCQAHHLVADCKSQSTSGPRSSCRVADALRRGAISPRTIGAGEQPAHLPSGADSAATPATLVALVEWAEKLLCA